MRFPERLVDYRWEGHVHSSLQLWHWLRPHLWGVSADQLQSHSCFATMLPDSERVERVPSYQFLCYAKCGPRTNSSGSTQEIRNAEISGPALDPLNHNFILTRDLGDMYTVKVYRTTLVKAYLFNSHFLFQV